MTLETTETEEVVEPTTEETTTPEATEATEASEVTTESTDNTSESTDTTDDSQETPEERIVPDVDSYKLPEGMPRSMAEFANKNDMTQEQLDASMSEFAEIVRANESQASQAMLAQGQDLVNSWGEQKGDNLMLVKRALDYHDTEGTMANLLDESGFGNHPQVLSFFLSIGQSLREGGFINTATTAPSKEKTAAAVMFGKSHPTRN